MVHYNLAKKMYYTLTDEKHDKEKEAWMEECKKTKLVLLWQIFFETDFHDKELLEERIYEFGSKVKQGDYFGREIFVCLVAFLNLVIKTKT